MAYTPTEWTDGEPLAANKFNKMENGLRAADSSYVPTEWTPGDVITAEALNKIENGIADAVEASVTVESLSVSENDTYTAPEGKAYSPITVAVPNTYAAGDEGKVVSNGALVAQTSTEITENDTYDTTLINSVTVNVPQGGGAEAEEKDVNFIDYDGTIRYSYTAQEFANLSELPPNPDHTDMGLTSQGWNWTLADAKEQAAEACPLWIGQSYITTSGNTEIDVEIVKGRQSLYIFFSVNGTARIDWGDGSTPDTLTGTTLNSPKNQAHTYAEDGKYTISIATVSGTCAIASWQASLLTNSSSLTKNAVYSGMVRAIRIGSQMQVGASAFTHCTLLETITLPKNVVVSSDSNLFSSIYALKALVIPNTDSASILRLMQTTSVSPYAKVLFSHPKLTGAASFACLSWQRYDSSKLVMCKGITTLNIGGYQASNNLHIVLPSTLKTIEANSLSGHGMLSELTIPASVTTIGNYGLQSNNNLAELHFKSSTPPTAGTGAFNSLPTTCKIYVPAGSLSAYTGEANYPSSSSYTYIEE